MQFVGRVRDLAAFYNQVRVVISPTRFGAGVKLKTVEGDSVRRAGRLHGGGRDRARAPTCAPRFGSPRTPPRFAEAVVALLTDRPAWERQRQLSLAEHDSSSIQRFGVGLWPAIIRSARSSGKQAEVSR